MINNAILPTLIYFTDQIIFVSRKPEAEGLEASVFLAPIAAASFFVGKTFYSLNLTAGNKKDTAESGIKLLINLRFESNTVLVFI